MTPTASRRVTVVPPSAPSTPRLRLEPTGSRPTLLDGGWWPRSTDPVAELPGLVPAIDAIRGRVRYLALSSSGWDSQPRRMSVAGRVLRLGYFTSQPVNLLTASCDNGERVDLLVVPPDTARTAAEAAMVIAATTGNLVHAQGILAAVTASPGGSGPGKPGPAETSWESEGGQVRP